MMCAYIRLNSTNIHRADGNIDVGFVVVVRVVVFFADVCVCAATSTTIRSSVLVFSCF